MKQLHIFKRLLSLILVVLALPANAVPLNGSYVVGPTGTYLTLADAVSDLVMQGVSGPTTFQIQSGTYGGSNWQASISSISGADNTNRVTFTSQTGNPASVTLQYSAPNASNNYIFLLNCSFVTIKNLTLQAQGTTYGSTIQFAGSASYDSVTGCVLSAPSTTATGVDMAVIAMGGAAPLSGSSDMVYNNTINNGSVGIWLAGSSSAATANHVIQNNTIANASYNGVYAYYANNLKLRNNTVSMNSNINNSCGFYLQYNGGGFDVSGNTITLNTTNNYHFGMYNLNINPGSSPVDAVYTNNNVNVTVTTGGAQALYNQFCAKLNITGNTFRSKATSSGGSAYPPTLMYSCNSSVAENNIFSAIGSSSGATVASGTYFFMSSANNCIVRQNTFNDSTTTGSIFNGPFYILYNGVNSICNKNTFNIKSTSGSIFGTTAKWLCSAMNSNIDSNVWNISSTSGLIGNTSSDQQSGFSNNVPSGSKISFSNNKVNITSSNTGTSYGLWGRYPAYSMNSGSTAIFCNDTFNITFTNSNTFYFWGYYGPGYSTSGTTWKMNDNVWNYSMPNGAGTKYVAASYYYFMYYTTNSEFRKNKIIVNTTNGTLYTLGYYYFGYRSNNFLVDSNDITINATSASVYGLNYYYFGYYSTDMKFTNNNLSITNTTGTAASFYNYTGYYSTNLEIGRNKFTINKTSGTAYNPYYLQYYGSNARIHDNTFNVNATSSATVYCPYYTNAYGSGDTVENNIWNVTTKGTIYRYNYYLNNLTRNNEWNLNTTSGSIYNYFYYCSGGVYENNIHKYTTTTGTVYGLYEYNSSSSYSGTLIRNNTFDLHSNSGSVYGFAVSTYAGKSKFIGNLFTTKTAGNSYLFYFPFGYHRGGDDMFFVNNTFHSNSNGSINVLLTHTGGSSSYPYKTRFYNNIFSSSYPVSGNTLQFGDTARFYSDYNLVYVPVGSVTMSTTNPSQTSTTLQQWRSATKRDLNSLIYDPGYKDAANFDFRPEPSNAKAWSVNGRGLHFPGDTIDIAGNVRAKTPADGVPDLGAYEFTPTSIPPDAVATPAAPAVNTQQVFSFGQDTVCVIDWGTNVPTSATVKQYTGEQAAFNPPLVSTTERMYGWVNLSSPTGAYDYNPKFYYKEPWRGTIPNETLAKFALSENGAVWQGYNYTSGITDTMMNILSRVDNSDSLPAAFTGVRNARIGIRCFYAPSGLGHANVIADQADETWEPEFNASYQIFADFSKFTPSTVPGSAVIVSTNSHHFSGLTEDKTYYVHLRTICGPKDTSGWSLDSFTTMITCHAPNLQITSLSPNRAVVYWDTIKTASSYEYVLDNNATDPAFGTYTLGKSVLCDYLKAGTTYYFHARTKCYTMYNISPWTSLQFTTPWPSGISTKAVAGENITVYPNPVKDLLVINVNGSISADAIITISDVTGKLVRTINITANKTEVEMHSLSAGMYIVRYSDKDRTEITKVNKE
jgi:parallel beta-helix repeat protein